MSSLVKPALERMDEALRRLEDAVSQTQLNAFDEEDTAGPELRATPALKAERDISHLVARKLDSAIDRLEALLAGE